MKLFRSRLERRRDRIIRSLPLRSPIFLPTDKIALDDAVEGLERVRALYNGRLDDVHRPRLQALRDRFSGAERCFVIGNGPSLNEMDLACLADEVTFAVNGFFIKSRELDWCPTFYVVEDHLVAEDRATDINRIQGSTKLFPASLAYCLDEDESTIFFDHRPRPSYPNGFDFSLQADHRTYAGCTVTFTCLQLAAYLGFRRIYLIGVDASYSLPQDVRQTDEYGVGVLDMDSDDPNHFDPEYFGKGYRWHDPQVDKMLEAYREAKRVTAEQGIEILNAGIGGRLEVFPRVEFRSLFRAKKSPSALTFDPTGLGWDALHSNSDQYPKLAVVDHTAMNDGTATGELKANLLGGWPRTRLLQVHCRGNRLVLQSSEGAAGRATPMSAEGIVRELRNFSPDVLIYRPVPEYVILHAAAMRYLRLNPTKLVVWVMDDWPERLRSQSPDHYERMDVDLRWLFDRADVRLVISESMAQAYAVRYGVEFEALANGVDPRDWPLKSERVKRELLVRYAGSLASDMTYDSVMRVAKAIEALAVAGMPIRFEINTRPIWGEPFIAGVRELSSCRVNMAELSDAEYRSFLRDADVLVVAYNFDERSKAYVRHSLANKLPECLIAGGVTLVHGPPDIATVLYVRDRIPEIVVSEPDELALRHWFSEIYTRDRHQELAERCRGLAMREFSLVQRRRRLRSLVRQSASNLYSAPIRSYAREEGARVDELELVREIVGRCDNILCIGPDAEDLHERLGEHGSRFAALVITAEDTEGVQRLAKIGKLLLEHRYSAYLSEWYPVEECQEFHRWKSIRRFVHAELATTAAPASLLAFVDDPPFEVFDTAIDRSVSANIPPLPDTPYHKHPRPWSYAGAAQAIRNRSERLFRFGQLIMRATRSLRKQSVQTLVLVAVVGVSGFLSMTRNRFRQHKKRWERL